MSSIFIVDVMPLLYRGHFAFASRPRMTSGGINTSAIWGLNTGEEQRWEKFLDYNVTNNTPELKYDMDNHDNDFNFIFSRREDSLIFRNISF